jgi:predicted HicB family RNase H-like nuclease
MESEMDEDEIVKQNLRLDERLHRRLAIEAKSALRSLNNEIQWRLLRSFEQPPGQTA